MHIMKGEKTMKKFAKLMVLALVVAALAAIFAIPSSATPGPVVYVASNGTGDGTTPQSPLGNSEGYEADNSSKYLGMAVLKACDKIKETGGTIVFVGPTYFDNSVSNTGIDNPSPDDTSYSTGKLPSDKTQRPTITFTSVYGGVDYRKAENGGAVFVLDQATCPAANFRLKNNTVWKDLKLEYRYNPDKTNYYNDAIQGIVYPFALVAEGHKIVIDTGVECASFNTKTNAAGDVYPAILGGCRYNSITGNTDVTVKSGTWTAIFAAGHSHSARDIHRADVKGDVSLKIENAKVGTIYGTGATSRAFGTVTGAVNIEVSNSEIGNAWLTNGEVYTGPGITMTVTNSTITGALYHSPIDGEILPEVSITVDGQPYKLPVSEETTTAPAGTDAPATQGGNKVTQKPATTKKPTGTTVPATTDDKKEEGSNLTLIIIIVVVAVVVIAAAVVVLLLIKKKKAAK